jgi:hypothetical protein
MKNLKTMATRKTKKNCAVIYASDTKKAIPWNRTSPTAIAKAISMKGSKASDNSTVSMD